MMAFSRAEKNTSCTSLTAFLMPSFCSALTMDGMPIAATRPRMPTTIMISISVKARLPIDDCRLMIEKQPNRRIFGKIGNRQSAIGNFISVDGRNQPEQRQENAQQQKSDDDGHDDDQHRPNQIAHHAQRNQIG